MHKYTVLLGGACVVVALWLGSSALAPPSPINNLADFYFSVPADPCNFDTQVVAHNYKSGQIVTDLPLVERQVRECYGRQ